MIDRPNPDPISQNDNNEQDDEDAQAQTVADEALDRSPEDGLSESDKVSTGDDSDDVQDLVDHMNQMESSGRIDMDAYRGERNDDDEDGMLGEQGDSEDAG